MGKSTSPAKKAATKNKKIAKASFDNSHTFLSDTAEDITPFAGTPIVSFGAIFNPETASGAVRLVLQGAPPKDFNQLNAATFAATLAILAAPSAHYNGQYIMTSRQIPSA